MTIVRLRDLIGPVEGGPNGGSGDALL